MAAARLLRLGARSGELFAQRGDGFLQRIDLRRNRRIGAGGSGDRGRGGLGFEAGDARGQRIDRRVVDLRRCRLGFDIGNPRGQRIDRGIVDLRRRRGGRRHPIAQTTSPAAPAPKMAETIAEDMIGPGQTERGPASLRHPPHRRAGSRRKFRWHQGRGSAARASAGPNPLRTNVFGLVIDHRRVPRRHRGRNTLAESAQLLLPR